jgi:hypothetical protein
VQADRRLALPAIAEQTPQARVTFHGERDRRRTKTHQNAFSIVPSLAWNLTSARS